MASTVLSVSWKDHSGALTEVCKTLLDNNFLVDCTIAAEGKALKAHRLILSACSPYFQMLFGDQFEKHPIVILQDASFETLKAMIDFMYHGETQVPENRLESFLTLAETLQIKGLNDTSKKNKRKPQPDDSSRETRRRPPPPPPPEDQKDTVEVQISSVGHVPSPDDSSEQHHSYHSEEYSDVAQNCSSELEGNSGSYEQVKPTPVIQSSQQELPSLPDQASAEAEQNVKSESIHHVFLVPKHEQMDEEDCDDPTQDVSECDISEEAAPEFDEQQINQYSSVPSCSESGGVLQGAYAMPQMAGPPDVQGTRDSPTQEVQEELVPGKLCSDCGAIFTTERRLARHMALHRSKMPFKCSVCEKHFARKASLQSHQRLHTGLRPYCCDICGLTFSQTGTLIRHRRSHTGERPYVCDICGKGFIQSSALDIHKRFHTGERPYSCPECDKTFITSTDLVVHKRKHTGERPYTCEVCGVSYAQSGSLKSHRRSHSQAKKK